jgi:hypothetical protein
MLHHAKPTRPAKEATIEVSDTPHAPFVFYEVAPAFGFTNGVVNITLSANRTWVGPNGVINEQLVVAYLRGNTRWPFWRGGTSDASKFHGSDGAASAPRLSIHLSWCGLAFTPFVSG